MNWYKIFLRIAIKGTYTILAGELAKEATDIVLGLLKNGIGKREIEKDIYCKSINKKITLNINLEIDMALSRDFIMGGDYDSDPVYKNNRVIDFEEEKVFLNIFINPNSDFHRFNRNDFYIVSVKPLPLADQQKQIAFVEAFRLGDVSEPFPFLRDFLNIRWKRPQDSQL